MAPDAYTDIEPFTDFGRVVDPSVYRPLPDDWLIGVSDVVNSSAAVKEGHYRAVNMAGAAIISAVTNALANKPFPFVFGGDGASLAVAPKDAATVREAMARTATWAKSTLQLELRIGLASVRTIKDAGYDVRVARHAASKSAFYAMFTGGGIEWLEQMLKSGHFALEPAADGALPDLTGLSCQWGPIEAEKDMILSIIVKPADGINPAAFAALVQDVLAVFAADGHKPVPEAGPQITWPGNSLAVQAQAQRTVSTSLWRSRLQVRLKALIAWLVFKIGQPINGFDPNRYRRQMALNTDYRKYDDGLLMTVDCTVDDAAAIEARLEAARDAGIACYGLHRQQTALMTCVAPSLATDDHLHFLDGGGGGYTQAAKEMRFCT